LKQITVASFQINTYSKFMIIFPSFGSIMCVAETVWYNLRISHS